HGWRLCSRHDVTSKRERLRWDLHPDRASASPERMSRSVIQMACHAMPRGHLAQGWLDLRRLGLRRMPPCFDPMTTARHNEHVVHFKRINRSMTNRCQANDIHNILAPAEMVMPLLCARIKQRYFYVGFRIDTMRLGPLIAVTPGTRQAQIAFV